MFVSFGKVRLSKHKSHKLSKLSKVNPKNGTVTKILADISWCPYGSVKEFGLANSATGDDFESRLASLREWWDSLCVEIHVWFTAKSKDLFKEKVIEEARQGSNINGLYYNKDKESMNLKKRRNDVISYFINRCNWYSRKIVERLQDDEICAFTEAIHIN